MSSHVHRGGEERLEVREEGVSCEFVAAAIFVWWTAISRGQQLFVTATYNIMLSVFRPAAIISVEPHHLLKKHACRCT